ncbi:MAG: FtsX-like permease family protein [Chitinivibrionales bacterium]|nr:FtsX-like permease family protein [Chitinivibrionales bacterium]
MGMIVTLAWRNLWRNKRRTAITAASVFTALFLALLTRSMQIGSYDKMVSDVVETYAGYVQIHADGYHRQRTINNTMSPPQDVIDSLRSRAQITTVIPRLESFALASGRNATRGARVVGIAPALEDSFTHLSDRIVDGEYFSPKRRGVLAAQGLAGYLQVGVGDTLVLLGQGYRGVGAAGKYLINGILSFPSPELNNQMVYLHLDSAQSLYAAQGRLTSLVLDLADPDYVDRVAQDLRTYVNTDIYEVLSWKQTLTELNQQIQADNAGGIIMVWILYVIVAFGIFGTITMMFLERTREIAVMLAVGTSRVRLAALLATESVFLALTGIVAGIGAAIPVLSYFHANPILLRGEVAAGMREFGVEPVIPFSMDLFLFVNNAAVVFCITMVCILYPLIKTARFDMVDALRA